MRMRIAGGLAFAGLLAVGCSACSSSTQAASHRSQHAGKKGPTHARTAPHSTTTTTGPTTATTGPTTTTTGPTTTTTGPTTTPGLARCSFAELSISPGQFGAGLGHEGGAIVFTNIGSTECTLTGYPGVAGLTSGGQEGSQAQRTPFGYLGGVRTPSGKMPVVDLQPGQSASAFVEGADIPQGNETSCPEYPALLVTPPTSKQSAKVTRGMAGCTLQVHPVVAGTTGDAS